METMETVKTKWNGHVRGAQVDNLLGGELVKPHVIATQHVIAPCVFVRSNWLKKKPIQLHDKLLQDAPKLRSA